MFTAQKAREKKAYNFDAELEKLVGESDNHSAYVPIRYGSHMEQRANAVADMLRERGFTVTAITDLDSFRFAEVHFTWE